MKTPSISWSHDIGMLHRIAYVLSTGIVVVAFVGSGLANLTHASYVSSDMHRLGYPDYFMTILGIWKVLGAIAIALPRLPRLKEWAYAGMVFDLTGGAASRAANSEPPHTVIVPLIIACLVFASWTLRPARRRLMAKAMQPR